MIGYGEIIAAANKILKENYPEIKRYGADAADKAVPPYFFVECVASRTQRESKNFAHRQCTVKITYIPRVVKQEENLELADEICGLLGMTLKVSGRKIRVMNYGYEFIEKNKNLLQVSWDMDWYENTYRKPEEPAIRQVDMEYQLRNGGNGYEQIDISVTDNRVQGSGCEPD